MLKLNRFKKVNVKFVDSGLIDIKIRIEYVSFLFCIFILTFEAFKK